MGKPFRKAEFQAISIFIFRFFLFRQIYLKRSAMKDSDTLQSMLQIEECIFTIRGLQVMLDSDLAELYGVEIKRLTEQVRRNGARFPDSFRFQLSDVEWDTIRSKRNKQDQNFLRSHFATLENQRGKHRKYMPYVFTEQGVAMLSAVLRSETAVAVSIRIMQAFVSMRNTLLHHAPLVKRVEHLEEFKHDANTRIDLLFKVLEEKSPTPKSGIFFEGQVFDAWMFASDLVISAEKTIILIDNYMDDTVLKLLVKQKPFRKAEFQAISINAPLLLGRSNRLFFSLPLLFDFWC
jgi:phage regulator Rha-like protein